MRTELSKAEVERLFIGAADDALEGRDADRLRKGLEEDPGLKLKLDKYKGALALLKKAPKEKAPPALASVILRRVRRRRIWGRNNAAAMQLQQYSLPMQVIVPILLGVLVAAFLVFAAP